MSEPRSLRLRIADFLCRVIAAVYRLRPGHHERLYRVYVRAVRHANGLYWASQDSQGEQE